MKKTGNITAAILAFSTLLLASCGNAGEIMQENKKTLYEKIQERGVVTVGTGGDCRPFSYHDEKEELKGYEVEAAKAVADRMGVKARFREDGQDMLLSALDSENVDLVMNRTKVTEERKEKYDFSEPYLYSYEVLITTGENRDIKDPESARGRKAALNLSGDHIRTAEKYRMDVKLVDSFQRAVELLKTGQVDCVIDSAVAVEDYLKENPESRLKIVDIKEEPDVIAVPVPKGNTDLLEAVNKAISDLKKNGVLQGLSEKYFGRDLTRRIRPEELPK